MAAGRVIAVGDIHGCLEAWDALLTQVRPAATDTLVVLGDYVDRGPDSRGVIERLIELSSTCHLVPILGNHDEQMLKARQGERELRRWLMIGGLATLESYGGTRNLADVPDSHVQFLESCRDWYETETHFFTHGNYRPELELAEQPGEVLRWLSLRDCVPGPHCSRKVAVVGHTPQREVLDLGHLIGVDTGCVYGGMLTALDVTSGDRWQAEEPSRRAR